jgi:ribosomal protein L29
MMSRLRRSRKQVLPPVLALGFAAGLLAACSAASTIDMIPSATGGLPSNAPQRSATPPEYPAVNEMPQRREALPLTEDELNRAKSELTTLRNQQEERAGTLPKSAAAPAKKDAAAVKTAKKAKDAKPAAELTSAKDQTK